MKNARGFTLIEVMVAMSVLGLCSVALFGLFSTSLRNLRRLQELHRYQLACEYLMDQIELLPTLPSQGSVTGRLSDLAVDWTALVSPWYPASLDGKPDHAIMKIDVTMTWITSAGKRNLRMESLKPAMIAYGSYDFSQALENAVPH